MSLLEAIIQGIIQGATEFLPVSSSGHLTLSQHVMGVQVESILFDVLLHFGTLMAVVFVYHKLIGRLIVECFRLIKAVVTGKFQWSQRSDDQNLLFMLLLGLAPLFCCSFPCRERASKSRTLPTNGPPMGILSWKGWPFW